MPSFLSLPSTIFGLLSFPPLFHCLWTKLPFLLTISFPSFSSPFPTSPLYPKLPFLSPSLFFISFLYIPFGPLSCHSFPLPPLQFPSPFHSFRFFFFSFHLFRSPLPFTSCPFPPIPFPSLPPTPFPLSSVSFTSFPILSVLYSPILFCFIRNASFPFPFPPSRFISFLKQSPTSFLPISSLCVPSIPSYLLKCPYHPKPFSSFPFLSLRQGSNAFRLPATLATGEGGLQETTPEGKDGRNGH